MPMAYMDPGCEPWGAKEVMLDRCDLGDVVVLGDSRAAADIIPGEYEVTIWHPLSRSLRPVLQQKLHIEPGATKLTLHAAAPLQLRADSQVPSNWDAY